MKLAVLTAFLPFRLPPQSSQRARLPDGLPAGLCLAAALALGACSSAAPRRAPVEDRVPVVRPAGAATPAASTANPSPAAVPAPQAAVPVIKPPPPGQENAGKPGYYSVKPGDTLARIGLETGQNWRDIARWNGLDNANLVEVGQVIRVAPPPGEVQAPVAVVQTRPVSPPARVDTRPLDPRTPAPGATPGAGALPPTAQAPTAPGAPAVVAPAPVASAPSPPVAAATAPAPAAAAAGSSSATREEDDITWSWPSGGPVMAGFDDSRSKGLVLGGRAGDAVLAAADGRVVYAGSGLRGYGNLVIVKHNANYLSAYAHNRALLVKEDQTVRRGQRIAEMGDSEAERVQLHFEIRRLGKPVDPARLLPNR